MSEPKAEMIREKAPAALGGALLLNEFLKEHRKVQELEAGMTTLIARVKEQASEMQKVRAQLELSKSAPQTVLNKQ